MLRRTRFAGRKASAIAALAVLGALVVAVPAEAAKPKCFGKRATIVGTKRGDELTGTNGRDVIVAGRGIDLVRARGGNDLICLGGGGIDFAFGGEGNDRIRGGRGFDAGFPQAGNDLFDGGGGFDLVTYEGSSTPITADLNADTATGQGDDRIPRVEGIAGSEADDHLTGTDDGDELHGYGGNDTLVGGAGDDFLVAGAGNDTVDGGDGHDFVDMVTSNAGPDLGDDSFTDAGVALDLAAGTATGPEGVGNDTLVDLEGASGTMGNDTLVGNDEFNELLGFEGDDTIDMGGPGEADPHGTQDVALPGAGNDTVTGSSGMDAVDYSFVSLVSEPLESMTIDLQAQTATGTDIGNDEFESVDYAVGGFGDDTLTGTAQRNLLIGLEGSDTLHGEAGDDLLDGDAFAFGLPFELEGNDTLDGGDGTDVCVGGSSSDANCESSEVPPFMRARVTPGLAFDGFGLRAYIRSPIRRT